MARLSRRTLLTGLAACLPLAVPGRGFAAGDAAPPVLTAGTRILDVNGRAAKVFSLTAPNGRPGLDLVLGERFRARLVNETPVETLIHWHGLTPPVEQDGVPMLSQPPLKPGGHYDYDFANTRSGTHWMHSHVGLQEQQLLAAPLIVRETAAPVFDEQEHVVLLHDFTFRDPEEILTELRGGGGAHAAHAMDHGKMDHSNMDHAQTGHGTTAPAPAMSAMLNDIVYDAYLANDRTLDDPEVVQVEKGGLVRLRVINAAAASNMWIDTGLLDADLIAVDGNAVHPVRHGFFPIAVAQRADIRVRIPREGGSFAIVFRAEGTTGRAAIILATPGAPVSREFFLAVPAPALTLDFEFLLRAVAQLPDEPVTRTEMVMLTGGGADYVWGLNGKSGMHDTIFSVREGEIVSVMIHNMTGMSHPMHLHGHYFKVTAIGNRPVDGALRDVVLVPPMETVTVTFHADNPGTWAFHCHHAYHMNAGMMGTITYVSAA